MFFIIIVMLIFIFGSDRGGRDNNVRNPFKGK